MSLLVRMKFGTWVKPWRVARSAPMISILRSFSLRMSPMRRGSEYSMQFHYTCREGNADAYPRLNGVAQTKNVLVKMSRQFAAGRDRMCFAASAQEDFIL